MYPSGPGLHPHDGRITYNREDFVRLGRIKPGREPGVAAKASRGPVDPSMEPYVEAAAYIRAVMKAIEGR